MSTGVKYNLRNSMAMGYKIANSSGIVNINRNNISMNIKANSSSGNAVVAGKINISNMKNPVYSFKGTMNNVDVSSFSGNIRDKSNLNAKFDINGRGINLNNLAGSFNLDFGNSFYSKYQIPKTIVNAKLNSGADSSSLQITNNAMEVKANGKFRIYSLIDAILYNVSMVSNIAEKKIYPDSNFIVTDLSVYNHSENVDFSYSVITKDSAEFRKLSVPYGIVFNGDVNGRLSNSSDGFYSKSVVFIKNFDLSRYIYCTKQF